MRLPELCIDRPVFATMLVMALVVLGLFSYSALGVDLFPKIDFPTMVITTRLPGAGPEEVETQITKIIEEAINTVEGIDELRSQSFEGVSLVIVAFKLHREISEAAQDVRDRIGRVVSKLPQGIDSPVIEKFDPDASPVITLVVSSMRPIQELTRIARKQVKEALESVSGVGQINVIGGQEREIHVNLDASKLKAHGVTSLEVKQALQRQNVELPGGLVETGPRDLVVRTMGRIARPEEFARVIVREIGGSLIRISDLGTVQDTREEQRTMARLDGVNAISLVVQKQSGTNTVQVVQEVKQRLDTVLQTLPSDVKVQVVRDQSTFILGSFHAVMEHIVLGAILASLVVLLFLGDLRTTAMVALSIPTSIISTFTLMYWEGFTLNQLSLLALALAIGLVIDDAIVVHENAFRHLEDLHQERRQATRDAVREIGLAVMATTFSLVVIFVPVAFMPGIVGRFLKTFGLTMVFAILTSLLVAFTLSPTLCAHFLKLRPKKEGEKGRRSWYERAIADPYLAMLTWSMNHRWTIVIISIVCVMATVPLMAIVGKDFIPSEDRSEFMVTVKAAEGTSLSTTAGILTRLETEIRKLGEIRLLFTTIGESQGAQVNEGQIYVGMTDLGKRKITQLALMKQTRELLASKFPELRTSVSLVPDFSAGFKQVDLNLTFQGPDLNELRKYSQTILDTIKGTPGVVDLDTSLNFGKPEVRVVVDRSRAANLGVDPFDVASTLRTLVGGDQEQVTKYKDEAEGEEYEVRVRLAEPFRNQPGQIAGLPVRARDGTLTLGSVADVREGLGPTEIDRYNRQRQVAIFANLQGIGLGEAQDLIDSKIKSMELKPGYSYAYLGRSKAMKEQQQGFKMAFILSALFMYMILAAQFESFVHPLTILLSLPLAIPFGVLSLVIAGERMHLFSTLGLFMLFGIVKKNAILQIDYSNTLRHRGMPRLKAILEANHTRLRPILMTTLTLVAGMIPMALGAGPGSGSRRAMAIVVIGGQSLCLLITLLLTPVAYSLFDDLANSRVVKRLQKLLD